MNFATIKMPAQEIIMDNYFIKLLLYSVSEDNFVLIYGFSSVTRQETRPWRMEQKGKSRHVLCRAILCKEDAEKFFRCLTEDGIVKTGKTKFSSPKLVRRSDVLANDGFTEQGGPILDFRILTEFWNVHKSDTFQIIEDTFPLAEIERYKTMRDLMDWAKEECGIDFFQDTFRFGNFECYKPSPEADKFKIDIYNHDGLFKTIVRTTTDLKSDLVVNCVAKYCERSIINQTKIFHAGDTEISFSAEEPMTHVMIQIWDINQGFLIYSKERALIDNMFFQINIGSTPYCLSDPWSRKLKQTAPGQKETITKCIETVNQSTSGQKFSTNNLSQNVFHDSLRQSSQLFAKYKNKSISGSFVSYGKENGEMNSFLKLREYIDNDHVRKVVLIDPYFSVESALKILTRISHTNIRMEIITSLVKTDPDSGKESQNIVEQYRKFMEHNQSMFPCSVVVCNLTRGGKQVFHDRYLLRYFEDGTCDGFLLSNSINSMGQRFPFVIAAMDHKVCLEVQEYIREISDSEIQNALPQQEQIRCDILFDSEIARENLRCSTQEYVRVVPLQEPLSKWYKEDANLLIHPQDLTDVLSVIFAHWNEEEKEQACKALCSINYDDSSGHLLQDLISTLKTIDCAEELFLDTFLRLARDIENSQDFSAYSVDCPERKLNMLMRGNAKLSKNGVHILFEDVAHICYCGDGWLNQGYALMLRLSPKAYLKMLEEVKSPLMLSVLIERMILDNWSEELFCIIAQSNMDVLILICAEWIHREFAAVKLQADQIMGLLLNLKPEKRLLLEVYLLSRIAYGQRVIYKDEPTQEQVNKLKFNLIECVAKELCECTEERKKCVLTWLQDCEITSNCRMHLELADAIPELQIKNDLLDCVIEIAKKELNKAEYEKDFSELILLYLRAFESRYQEEQDLEGTFMSRLLERKTFETATEPELKNYAYKKWHKAYMSAKRQMAALHIFCAKYPEAQKAAKWIKEWEPRLDSMKQGEGQS